MTPMKALIGTSIAVCVLWIAVDANAFRPGMGYGCSPYDGQPCNIPEQHIDRFELGQDDIASDRRAQDRLDQRRMADEMERQSRVLDQQRANQRTRDFQRSIQRSYQPPSYDYGHPLGLCADGMC